MYNGSAKFILANAIKELMRDVPLLKISVGDICEKAGLNRKTFYYHFKDKFDLVNWIFQTEFIEVMKVQSYTSGWKFISEICGYLYSERAFYNNALQYQGQNSFRDYFSSAVGVILLLIVGEGLPDSEDTRFYITFLTDALLTSIIRWLTELPDLSPVEFVRKLRVSVKLMENITP